PGRHLVPRERAGDGGPGPRTGGERGGDRLPAGGRTPGDVHLASARVEGAGDRRDVPRLLDGQPRQEVGEAARLRVGGAGTQGQQDVQPGGARRLDVIRQRELVEPTVEGTRDRDSTGERS